jgi:hypothetical protein
MFEGSGIQSYLSPMNNSGSCKRPTWIDRKPCLNDLCISFYNALSMIYSNLCILVRGVGNLYEKVKRLLNIYYA